MVPRGREFSDRDYVLAGWYQDSNFWPNLILVTFSACIETSIPLAFHNLKTFSQVKT